MGETGPDRTAEGTLLWEPSAERAASANITRYVDWLKSARGLTFDGYQDLWQWSVTDLAGFWSSIWDFYEVKGSRSPSGALGSDRMPGARWFAGARLNYAEHALSRRDGHPAVLSRSELRPMTTLSYGELYREVSAAAAGLRRIGVGRGDRVVAYMPNITETLVAFLATASIGAVWSACSPEFGTRSVLDRFRQVEPAVLIAVDGYRYGGRDFDRTGAVEEIRGRLPGLKHTVTVPYLYAESPPPGAISWAELTRDPCELAFEPVPFDHPLWVLYSSGTTGLPKPIVQGHGGILLEHLKYLSIHTDLTSDDRFFWFTTTGWMMWNLLIGGLLLDATVVLFDGDPAYPDMGTLWRLAEDTGTTYFGCSAPYINACMKAGVEPGREFDVAGLKGLGSTGSPLSPEGFRWVYEAVKPDIHLGSVSGGTDLCTAFVGACPTLPVRAGEIQCLCLGADVRAYDHAAAAVVDQVGELVIARPMPSMPIYLWNDASGHRYRESYFDVFPGVWRHGDWIKVTPRGSCVIYGRSDSTLNRGGVRMGTSEFYRVVEELEEVADSLVVDTGGLGEDGLLLLFLELRAGVGLDDDLRRRLTDKLRREVSPRHVPDEMFAVAGIPKTLNGKKMEVPVRRILAGASVEGSISRDSMSDPATLQPFVDLAAAWRDGPAE